jgi:hypothetical protein
MSEIQNDDVGWSLCQRRLAGPGAVAAMRESFSLTPRGAPRPTLLKMSG